MTRQCPSCGGFCGSKKCERENIMSKNHQKIDTSSERVDGIKLPPLPYPYNTPAYRIVGAVIQEHARAAIEADRQADQITGETSDGYHTFNELYAHRVRLFCLLMHAHKGSAWWSRKHHDGSAWEGWVIAGIDTPEGSATYHLPESEIENLPKSIELPNGKEWDGHTSNDVLVRLLSLRQARGEPVGVQIEEIIESVKAYGRAYSMPNTTATELTIRLYDIRTLLAKYTAPQPQQIPEGYKLVPIEPTKGMTTAAKSAGVFDPRVAMATYKAMLEAAPEPKEKP